MNSNLQARLQSENGSSLVAAMVILGAVGVLALVVAHLAVGERRTTFQNFVANAAFHSADSGSEAAVHWLTNQNRPPRIPALDVGDMTVHSESPTTLHDTQRYAYRMEFQGQRPKAGWGFQYTNFLYDVESTGEAATDGNADVSVVVGKINVQGYQPY